MTILRSDLMVALNNAIVACREAADQHHVGAEACADAAGCRMLAGLAERRAASADALARFVLAKHDIPNAPNAEKELLAGAISRAKAALLATGPVSLLEDSRTREAALASAVEAALAEEPESELRTMLRTLAQDVAAALGWLERATAD